MKEVVIRLSYGLRPKHFLEEDATPQDLFSYLREFYQNFAGGIDNAYDIETTGERINSVYVDLIRNYIGTEHYLLHFHQWLNGRKLSRSYKVYPNKLILSSPEEDSPGFEEIPQKTDGEHAWFITSHLKVAGIIRLQRQGLLESSRN